MRRLLVLPFLFLICESFVLSQYLNNLEVITDTARIKEDLFQITHTPEYRNYKNIESLNQVADYIYDVFDQYCDTVYYQKYEAYGNQYKNVVGIIGRSIPESKIIVGAHYDVAGNQQGADDNASGVVGLLELARNLKSTELNHPVELVAFSLEEPPFFRTEYMGSYIHAKSIHKKKEEVLGMLCFDMIGYFDSAKKTQKYPIGFLKWFYGSKGDYITIVQKFGNGRFGRKFKHSMKKQHLIRTKSIKAPAKLPGIDFSDHQNYWKYGYDALMVTNTAFYRNPNYHKAGDVLETLDIQRMSQVINQVYNTLISL